LPVSNRCSPDALGSTNFAQRNPDAALSALHKIRPKNDKKSRGRTALVLILYAIENYSRRSFAMKKLLALILGIAVLATLGGLATAGKPSKQQSDNRAAVSPTPTPTSKAKGPNAVNVKLARTVLPNPTPTPNANATIIKSKSNITNNKQAATPTPTPNTKTNLNSSRSN